MSSQQHKLIKSALFHFQSGDFSLGYRILLDTALNTNNAQVFRRTLSFVEVYESKSDGQKMEVWEDFQSCSEMIKNTSIDEKETYGELILEGKNLVKNYNQGRFVLGPVNISLHKGDIYGLVGENGNGKTTLLTILALLNKTSGGTVKYYLKDTPKTD